MKESETEKLRSNIFQLELTKNQCICSEKWRSTIITIWHFNPAKFGWVLRKKNHKNLNNVLPLSTIIYEQNIRIWVTVSLTSFPCLLSTQTYCLAKLFTECLVSLICYSLVFQPKSYLLPFSCSWLPMMQHCLPHHCLCSQGFLLCCSQKQVTCEVKSTELIQ